MTGTFLSPGKPADSDIVEMVRSALEMLSEYPETDPFFIGAERLGRLVGRSGRWVRQRENERVIERASTGKALGRQFTKRTRHCRA